MHVYKYVWERTSVQNSLPAFINFHRSDGCKAACPLQGWVCMMCVIHVLKIARFQIVWNFVLVVSSANWPDTTNVISQQAFNLLVVVSNQLTPKRTLKHTSGLRY